MTHNPNLNHHVIVHSVRSGRTPKHESVVNRPFIVFGNSKQKNRSTNHEIVTSGRDGVGVHLFVHVGMETAFFYPAYVQW